MNPDDIARILDDLGRRLGPAGEYAFSLAVRYEFTSAAISVAFGLLLAVASAIGIVVAWRYDDESGASFPIRIFGGLFGSIGGVVGLSVSAIALPNLLNPEYAAIRSLLWAIR